MMEHGHTTRPTDMVFTQTLKRIMKCVCVITSNPKGVLDAVWGGVRDHRQHIEVVILKGRRVD